MILRRRAAGSALVLWLAASPLLAQYDRPPERGGRTYALGMPPIWKGYAGGGIGWFDPSGDALLLAQGHIGVSRDLVSPVVGAAAVGVELYGGYRGATTMDGGVRALFGIPALRASTGVDYNLADGDVSGVIRLEFATRRSGIFGRGSLLRLEWFPGHHGTVGAGVSVPLWGRNVGRTRPRQAAAAIERPPLQRVALGASEPALDSALAALRDQALWIARLTMPLLDRGGADPATAYAPELTAIRERLGVMALAAGQRAFHDGIDRLFGAAVGSASDGPEIGAAARQILLDEVLLPYDRLLGQRKDPDGLGEYVASANATFAGLLLRDGRVTGDRFTRMAYAFEGLLNLVEAVRALQRERWQDSRFVWLPLQLALREEAYDTQSELDALIARATEVPFTHGNRIAYVMNEAFQLEFARSVLAAEEYHVLWIHDYRGHNGAGQPDRIGFEQVRVYLEALTRRVREYDRTGQLPQYFIFLDQNYFEANDSRLYLRLLHDPLDATLRLPAGFDAWEREFATAQAGLRAAVEASHVLQAERRQYGDRWLQDRIRVHVNITNPADNSFTSNHAAGILPVPDNVMRDHRKIAFYDLTERDPWRGRAMYTGMGVGEHYAGANWEDRAIILEGPAALELKTSARQLLEQQGFGPDEIPFPLRPRPMAPDAGARSDSIAAALATTLAGGGGTALQLHNRTGYAPKPVDVEKAILYTMMPSGSVLYIGDSLWQSWVYASMLVGSAMRGCHVLIIAPSARSAPSAAAPTMARAHALLSALLVWRRELDGPITAQGGMLRVGLYAPRVGVGDLAGRIRQASAAVRREPWMTRLLPGRPDAVAVVDSIAGALEAAGARGEYLVQADSLASPKLHMKVNLLVRSEVLAALMTRLEWTAVLREYFAYLARQKGPVEGRPPAADAPAPLIAALQAALRATLPGIPAQERERTIAYLTVGSANMDYRSMVMDGEVMVTVTGWTTLAGLLDYAQIVGLSDWPETQDALDALLPPPGGMTRSMANLIRLLL